MRSVEARFKLFELEGHSSFTQFVRAITGQQFDKKSIDRWFGKLVEKEDFSKGDKEALLNHCYTMTMLKTG